MGAPSDAGCTEIQAVHLSPTPCAVSSGPVLPLWGQFLPDMPILTTAMYFVGALLVGALVITVVSRWRKKAAGLDRLTEVDQLAHFRTLYEQGELSEEEFNQLRALLGGKIRRKDREVKPKPEPPLPGEEPGPPETGIRPSGPPEPR